MTATPAKLNRWSLQTVDRGILAFDRADGQNLLLRSAGTAHLRRQAPRVLQIGLLTPCNLHCDFCYRDTSAPSRLTAPYLLDLLGRAAQWGVLEVAFGGGEPLLFRGFAEFIEELHRTTPLGINFTTNGTLLTRELLVRLSKTVGEIRVSAYADNHYRRTLRMARGLNVAVNWLVTPANVGLIEPYVHDFLSQGARNVLLLGYKGPDPSLHLRGPHFATLKMAVSRLQHLPLRLDICWHPHLADLHHLFAKKDCGAGDEFLVITPDRAVQPCSFHHERIPFETFDELRTIYATLQARRPPAEVPGCTRSDFATLPATPSHGLWMWRARAGNNSGDWTIVGRFREVQDAQKAADALRELARAHEAFLASPEGHQWLIDNDYYGNVPTPPLEKFGAAHGFDWTRQDDGLWWEENGCGAAVLTAGIVGNSVVVYHPYCMGLPEEPFRKFFTAVGAVDFGYWQYDRPMVVARAWGHQPAVVARVREYLKLICAAEYASDIKKPPPWGEQCSTLLDDEDRGARIGHQDHKIEEHDDHLILGFHFENTFAGALALEDWLKKSGCKDVAISIEQPLQPLNPAAKPVEPAKNLFGGHVPLTQRLAGMSSAEIMEVLFEYHSDRPEPLKQAVAQIPIDDRVRLARSAWRRCCAQGRDVTMQALCVIDESGPAAQDWMSEIWPLIPALYAGFGIRALAAALPKDEAFALARAWLQSDVNPVARKQRLQHFGQLHHEGTIDLIERYFETAPPNEATLGWPTIAAQSEMKWPTIARWLRSGRPLSLIALGVLEQYVARGLPPKYDRPRLSELREILTACKINDPAPRPSSAVVRLLEHEADLAC